MRDMNIAMHFDNYRQIKIVKMLMDSDDPIQCSFFSKYFHVSERMIRDDIKALKSILNEYQVNLLSKRGIGYYLELNDVDLETIIQNSLGSLYYYDNVGVIDKFAREQLILRYLILCNHSVKPQTIMDEFYISRTTLKKDLERAKETIEHYPIELITEPYKEIYLKGSEVGKRMLLNRETAFYKDKSIFHMLYDRIEMNGITIEDLLAFVKFTCHIEISNIELFNLYSHLNIMLLRISQNQFVRLDELIYNDYMNENELSLVKQYLNGYEDFRNIPEAEYIYFYLLIYSSGHHKIMIDMDNEWKAKNLLDRIESDTGISVLDSSIVHDLGKLWKPLEIKAKNHFSSSPLLIRDIKKYKPLAIELACRFVSYMNVYYQFHPFDNDICAIAYLFQKHSKWKRVPCNILVISARGSFFTEGLLQKNLQEHFEKESFNYCDLYDLDKIDLSKIDFLISDISLSNHTLDIPVIKVDFFKYEKDLQAIANMCMYCLKTRIVKDLEKIIEIEARCKEEVLNWYADKFADNKLYNDMIDREEMLTYEVNKKLAMICVFLAPNIQSVTVRFPELYWKNAAIEHAIFVNLNYDAYGNYPLYEEMILYEDFIKTKK